MTGLLLCAFRTGDTYTIDPNISADNALRYWTAPEKTVFVCEADDTLLGTYYIRANQGGGGNHVCNCGFITATAARGRGIARKMLAHALIEARDQSYRAMQFNFVVANNTRAIAIWEQAGFDTVGRLPSAFLHPDDGYVDALIMYKNLV